jgi:hypothetical protein
VVGALAAGCGGSSSHGKPDAAPDAAPIAFDPASHPALPQAASAGGPVLAAPRFVAVTFPGDALATTIDDFVATLGHTAYWTQTTMEYGVGPATGVSVHLTASPPSSIFDGMHDADLQQWIEQQLASGAFPPADAGTVYMMFDPAVTTVFPPGFRSGWHDELVPASGPSVVYAVIRRPQVDGHALLDILTGVTSHEMVEAATDPLFNTRPAYKTVDPDDLIWGQFKSGGEVADLCQQMGGVHSDGLPYLLVPSWSNAAALASHDPCVPSAGPYFNSAPVLDTLALGPTGQQVHTRGVQVAVGQSATVELDLFSDAPTSGPWTVSASGFPLLGGKLELALDRSTGENGDRLHLTIHVLEAGPQHLEAAVVQSQLGDRVVSWPFLISSP